MEKIEKIDKSLEEAAEEYVKTTSVKVWGRINPKEDLKGYMARANYGVGLLDGFKAGAEWQKEQMLKDAVEGEIQMRYSGCLCAKTISAINEDKFKFGDKVCIVVLKAEEE